MMAKPRVVLPDPFLPISANIPWELREKDKASIALASLFP